MSSDLAKPNYSHNPVLDGAEHLWHWTREAEHAIAVDTVGIVRKVLTEAKDLHAQFPTLAQQSGDVLADLWALKVLGAAIAAAVAAGGTNLAADAGVLSALVTEGPQLIKLFSDGGKLAETIVADAKTDLSVLEK
jgi:hypothetical protein